MPPATLSLPSLHLPPAQVRGFTSDGKKYGKTCFGTLGPYKWNWKKSFEQDGQNQQELGDIHFKLSLPVYPATLKKGNPWILQQCEVSMSSSRPNCFNSWEALSFTTDSMLSWRAESKDTGHRQPWTRTVKKKKSPSSLHWFTLTSWMHHNDLFSKQSHKEI